jgi:hypothetical protein
VFSLPTVAISHWTENPSPISRARKKAHIHSDNDILKNVCAACKTRPGAKQNPPQWCTSIVYVCRPSTTKRLLNLYSSRSTSNTRVQYVVLVLARSIVTNMKRISRLSFLYIFLCKPSNVVEKHISDQSTHVTTHINGNSFALSKRLGRTHLGDVSCRRTLILLCC